MQNEEGADLNGWREFVTFCEKERRRVFAQLEPLEEGIVHTGKRELSTGGAWIDTTNEEIQRLRKEVANLDAMIAKQRQRTG